MSDFIIIIFLFPIFFMIHEFEEIIMIQKWINHNQIKLTQRFPHLYPIIKNTYSGAYPFTFRQLIRV